MKTNSPQVCVVGSCNMDLIAYVSRMPLPGETLHGEDFSTECGGKGANQAVMAAKLGVGVSMIGKVGADGFGRELVRNFKSHGVDTGHLHVCPDSPSGVAQITVNAEGQNSIIVIAGANHRLLPEEIEAARPVIAASQVLVCQMEVPIEVNLKALRVAKEEGVRTLFNPAPARELPEEVYPLCDIFCPNETETAQLTGMEIETPAAGEAAARMLLERGCGAVLLTLGARGVMLVDPIRCRVLETQRVRAVDSSGAGDCFVGSLAALLAGGHSLAEAASRAVRIATLSVRKPGTQSSYPSAAEVEGLL